MNGLKSKYKSPKKVALYRFALDFFYFVIDNGEIMIYKKNKYEEVKKNEKV